MGTADPMEKGLQAVAGEVSFGAWQWRLDRVDGDGMVTPGGTCTTRLT
jgi:hypothetical protein